MVENIEGENWGKLGGRRIEHECVKGGMDKKFGEENRYG